MLSQAAQAAAAAIKAFVIGAVLLTLTLIAGLFSMLAQMTHFARRIAAIVGKVLIIAFLVVTTLNAAYQVWLAYGADIPAIILSALLVVVMTGWGLTWRNWGALLLCGLAALAIGTAIGSTDIIMRSLIIVGALATTIAQTQFNSQESDNHEQAQKQHDLHLAHQDRSHLLHDGALDRSGDEHHAGEH